MLCENCGKREANVRYSENINGRVKQMNLCEECSKKLGIGDIDFNIPMDFSDFFGEFMEEFSRPEFMPLLSDIKKLKCNNCGYTFQDIVDTGTLGCKDCYDVFQDRLDPIIKKIQGSNRHVGRIGKIIDDKIDKKMNDIDESSSKDKKQSKENIENKEISELEKLQEKLRTAIKEERYEDAAKLRDKIKKLEK